VLAEIGALLGSALGNERALSRLVRLTVPVLGDLGAIDLVQDKDELGGPLARTSTQPRKRSSTRSALGTDSIPRRRRG
jgi:hypothetical protein